MIVCDEARTHSGAYQAGNCCRDVPRRSRGPSRALLRGRQKRATRGDRQNDVVTYGVSLARAVKNGVEVVAEINGRANTRSNTPPVGTESRSMMRVGTRYTRGLVRLDAALLVGVTERDPSWGLTAGFTWVFKAFKVPTQ